ncbi:MAG: hypothetical protein P857_622 [Candidatus Xenolissoclinum pacificiensis L6]|uniref:Uncharacterized protein n=1 Tax=Candidatus Xenolissoclinum pacificiensis L6 TaxID=1401685 RepID=W2UYD8_9RICK|nr:MAG: hypothetical protein P857_622 [Candidatus Xenolissoclinum pacificiensis L6]
MHANNIKKYKEHFETNMKEICINCLQSTIKFNTVIKDNIPNKVTKSEKSIQRIMMGLYDVIIQLQQKTTKDVSIYTSKYYMNDNIAKFYVQDILTIITSLLYSNIIANTLVIKQKNKNLETSLWKPLENNVEHISDLLTSFYNEHMKMEESDKDIGCLQYSLDIIYVSFDLLKIAMIDFLRDYSLQELLVTMDGVVEIYLGNICDIIQINIMKIKNLFSEMHHIR